MSDGFLFDFAPPPVDVRTTSPTGVQLPVSGSCEASRYSSQLGAQKAAATRGEDTRRYLEFLATAGMATDENAADQLGLRRSSICSIRNAVMRARRVIACGHRMGGAGVNITLWRLTTREERESWGK